MHRFLVFALTISLAGCGSDFEFDSLDSRDVELQSGIVFITDYHDIGLNYFSAQFFESGTLAGGDELVALQNFLSETPADTCIRRDEERAIRNGVVGAGLSGPSGPFLTFGDSVELRSRNQRHTLPRKGSRYFAVAGQGPALIGMGDTIVLTESDVITAGDSDWTLSTSAFELALPPVPFFRVLEPSVPLLQAVGKVGSVEMGVTPALMIEDDLYLRWESDNDAPIVVSMGDTLCLLDNDGEQLIHASELPSGRFHLAIQQIRLGFATTPNLPYPILLWSNSRADFSARH